LSAGGVDEKEASLLQDEEELTDGLTRSERAIRQSRLLIDEANKILARGEVTPSGQRD
jgi:hypothetical protein